MKFFLKLIIFLALFSGVVFGGVWVYAFSPNFIVSPQLENKNIKEILPDDTLVINFDKPIDIKYYKNNIKLSPQTPMQAKVDETLKKIIITPKTAWKINTNYAVIVPEGRAKNMMQISAGKFDFKTVDYPKVINISPENGATDVRLDIEDPIEINLDKSSKDFFMDFRLSPSVEVKYENNEDKTQFKILPQMALADDTIYTLKVFTKAKNARDEEYNQIYETSFKTFPPKPKTWSQNLTQRVEEAKKFTQAQIKEGKYIDVNLATQIMTIFENGKILDSFLISSGKRGMDTPKGEHQIYNKNPRPWSKKYGLYMPFWMAITSDGKYGIHELPEWPGGYKEGQSHLGIPVSHGCMRLGVGPASFVYNWAEIGTPVLVY